MGFINNVLALNNPGLIKFGDILFLFIFVMKTSKALFMALSCHGSAKQITGMNDELFAEESKPAPQPKMKQEIVACVKVYIGEKLMSSPFGIRVAMVLPLLAFIYDK